jgi:MerR family transcriptional regulator, thiopeptide resistance regulator
MHPEWSIQQLAKLVGTTSRTLRHYDAVGLLPATGRGANGYRSYDAASLVRLQRILLLRELGLGLPQIGEVLARGQREQDALAAHLDWLRDEQGRIGRQIAAVASTIHALENGETPMAEKMFDGFDHTVHEAEVTARWGADAYASGDRWWRGMSDEERAAWQARTAQLATDWTDAAARGIRPESDEAQALAGRHIAWLSGVPGTPADTEAYVLGLADLYVSDPRFAANYGGESGASFVRAALRHRLGAD